MARKLQITAAILVVILLVAAVGAYAWDSARSDQIADGITIGGVDVGGMTADDATAAVDAELVAPLRKKVTVKFEGVKYQLSAEKLGIDSDVQGMVDQALEESRQGGLPDRVWRYATGGEVDAAISPQVTYSNHAIDEFITKVADEVNRDPVDASIDPSTTSLGRVAGEDGVSLDQGKLRSRIESAVQSPTKRTVSASVTRVPPSVTEADLAAKYPTYITIDRSTFQLRLWTDLKLTKTYTVAVGQQAYETTAGLYAIQSKQVNPSWYVPDSDWAGDLAGQVIPPGPEDPLKARFMGFNGGAGIHGTDELSSLGSAASHGCIRMAIPDVIDLYDRVDIGTPVYIQ